MSGNVRGFTIAEVLVAVVVLTVGIAALVGSSGMVTRMVNRGKVTTFAAQLGEQRLEQLRAAAAVTNPPCLSGSFASGSAAGDATTQYISESWTVPTTGWTRVVKDSLTYRVPGGTRNVVVSTLVSCLP